MKYFLLLLLVFVVSCAKESSCSECDIPSEPLEAQVINSGSVALDGCDWVIRVGATDLSPANLPDSFKISQLPVIVSFTVTDRRFLCGMQSRGGLPIINLVSIKKQ